MSRALFSFKSSSLSIPVLLLKFSKTSSKNKNETVFIIVDECILKCHSRKGNEADVRSFTPCRLARVIDRVIRLFVVASRCDPSVLTRFDERVPIYLSVTCIVAVPTLEDYVHGMVVVLQIDSLIGYCRNLVRLVSRGLASQNLIGGM